MAKQGENQGLDSIKDSENPFDPRVHRFFSTEEREMAIHRHLCDTYMHPRHVGSSRGATMFYIDGNTYVRGWAKEALKFYNWKQQKNFNLEKVVKLNSFAANSYLTFWAQSAESDERCLFRAAVTGRGGSEVLLCEIRDDIEITIPSDHPEICLEEDQSSPPCNESSFTTYLTSVTCLGSLSMAVLVVLMISAVAKLFVMFL